MDLQNSNCSRPFFGALQLQQQRRSLQLIIAFCCPSKLAVVTAQPNAHSNADFKLHSQSLVIKFHAVVVFSRDQQFLAKQWPKHDL